MAFFASLLSRIDLLPDRIPSWQNWASQPWSVAAMLQMRFIDHAASNAKVEKSLSGGGVVPLRKGAPEHA